MQITKVSDKKTRKQFLDAARIIYRDDKVWVCPFDNEIEAIFDPEKNPYFKHGEVERWILLDDSNNITGRIAAFIDKNLAHTYDQPTGGTGFFECINDKDSAFLLFDTAREWLRERGMEAMDGPINFGETDKYWGLLVGGFTHPSFEVPYNPPYYQELFESYGFQTYYKMEGFHLDITKPLDERFMKIAEWVSKKPGYEFRHFTWKDQKKFTQDFALVFNEAWASFKTNFEPLQADYINTVLKKAKAIIDEEFIWLAYFEGKPIAIYLMFPDLNMILKHLNGKLDLFSMIKFLYLKKRNTMTRAKGLLMGVIPKYQNHGIESAFILKVREVFAKKPHYTEVEFSWVADFNPKMRKIFISVGSVPAKNYITYRYLFDRTKEFKRYPIPESK
ncbi:MAG: GNAT family N-acetyltransferase [Bacteroidales bacterium]|nr:GNAT family N-acetyltransferase [Bacteroidales bacterium]